MHFCLLSEMLTNCIDLFIFLHRIYQTVNHSYGPCIKLFSVLVYSKGLSVICLLFIHCYVQLWV